MVSDRHSPTPGLAVDPKVVHGPGVGQAGDVFQTDLGSALATAVELARQARTAAGTRAGHTDSPRLEGARQ